VSDRISDASTIILNDRIEKVFPLFGPIREKDWADGWNPEIIYSDTELVEQHMIFKTKSSNDVEKSFLWTITTYDPAQYEIEYTVSTENRIWFIRVKCAEVGEKTEAKISYTYTGLNEIGDQLNAAALKKMYTNRLKDWEDSLNYYLSTGNTLREP
jgi:hypothetical protein